MEWRIEIQTPETEKPTVLEQTLNTHWLSELVAKMIECHGVTKIILTRRYNETTKSKPRQD